MWRFQRSKRSEPKAESSASAEVNLLDLCENSVRNVEDVVKRRHLLNLRQCQDLSDKVSKTIQNIREIYSYCGASYEVFRPALKNLYRYVRKAEALVRSCAEKEWCAAAVFQCQNENAFREILLDVSLCYSAIYEHAKSARDDWIDAPNDLRRSSVLVPASGSAVDDDNKDLQKGLNDHANEFIDSRVFDRFNGSSRVQKRFLANYLLTKMCHRPLEPQASTLDVYSPLLWPKGLEPSRTWGSLHYLGAGSCGTVVWRTKWLGTPCAKKDIHEEGSDGMFLKEAGIMAHLKHPCIVNFICCGNGSKKGDRFIAMELMEKSLFGLIEEQEGVHFALNVAIDMIVQMARGVRYLHDQGVAHRDLKPQNVVVKRLVLPHLEDHFSVKLVDFGISKIKVGTSQLNTMTSQGIGTTRYRAPEANPGEGRKVDWSKVDVFSFAMTCAHLLSLETPFQEIVVPSVLYKEVSKNGRRPKLPDRYPEALVMLLKDCWKSNPSLRPSFKEICIRLETLKYGDASVDGVEGGFGVDLNYIKEKMEEKVSEGSILVEEVEDKTFDLQVPILSCMCGSAMGAFHESSYRKLVENFRCNICWEDCHEEVYHCGSCDFDAHPSCLEINERVEVFFHDHPLHLLIKGYHNDKLDTTCYMCKESLQHSDWVYRCEQCDLDVHALCTKYPKELRRECEHRDPLNLIQYLLPKRALCICCNGEVMRHSWRYTCIHKFCDFDIHPYCITMVPSYMMCVFDATHQFKLVRGQRGFHCSICGSLGFSWLYHCEDCKLDGHVECLGVVKGVEEHWSGAYEELLQEYKTQGNHNMMHMVMQVLEHIFGSDSFEGGTPSTSSMTPVAGGSTRGVQPHMRTLAASETPDLGAIDFDDADLRKRIAAETINRRAKRMAAQAGSLESKAMHLESLKNVERIVLEVQRSKSVGQRDRAVLDVGLEKLKIRKHSVEDDMATLVQSRMHHGPRTCMFYQDKYINRTVWELLTSLRADMKDVTVIFLCEEPGHEHYVDGCMTWGMMGVLGEERVQILQALLGRGLEVVARVVSTSEGQLTGLDRVKLPVLGSRMEWDLGAIHVEKHGKPLDQEENVDVLKRAEDSAAKWVLDALEIDETHTLSRIFGLLRVRYKESTEGNCLGYTRGSVAWLCKEHVHRGIEAGILESYPVKFYNPELN